ncbi:hypothetical protein [Streptomyces sp. NPDC058475]
MGDMAIELAVTDCQWWLVPSVAQTELVLRAFAGDGFLVLVGS